MRSTSWNFSVWSWSIFSGSSSCAGEGLKVGYLESLDRLEALCGGRILDDIVDVRVCVERYHIGTVGKRLDLSQNMAGLTVVLSFPVDLLESKSEQPPVLVVELVFIEEAELEGECSGIASKLPDFPRRPSLSSLTKEVVEDE